MAHAAAMPSETVVDQTLAVRPTVQAPPVTPGKVAMWLFLATEVMFFTGLIGSYVVRRAVSPPNAYSNLVSPATKLDLVSDYKGVLVEDAGRDPRRVAEILMRTNGITEEQAERLLHGGHALTNGMPPAEAVAVAQELKAVG